MKRAVCRLETLAFWSSATGNGLWNANGDRPHETLVNGAFHGVERLR